jgi:hypothetical protein
MDSKKYFFLSVGLMALANAGYGVEDGKDDTCLQCGPVSPVLGAGARIEAIAIEAEIAAREAKEAAEREASQLRREDAAHRMMPLVKRDSSQ